MGRGCLKGGRRGGGKRGGGRVEGRATTRGSSPRACSGRKPRCLSDPMGTPRGAISMGLDETRRGSVVIRNYYIHDDFSDVRRARACARLVHLFLAFLDFLFLHSFFFFSQYRHRLTFYLRVRPATTRFQLGFKSVLTKRIPFRYSILNKLRLQQHTRLHQ